MGPGASRPVWKLRAKEMHIFRGVRARTALMLSFGAVLLRLWHLGYQGIWTDEAFSYWVSRLPFSQMISLLKNFDSHPPFYYFFLHLWGMFGHSLFFLRLPSVIAGGATVYFTVQTARLLFGERAALFAGALWGMSFVALGNDTLARMYSFAVVFPLISSYLLWQCMERGGRWRWLLYCFFAILSLTTHYATGFILLAHLCYLSYLHRWKELILISGLFLVGLLPCLPIVYAQVHHGSGTAWGFTPQALREASRWFLPFFFGSSLIPEELFGYRLECILGALAMISVFLCFLPAAGRDRSKEIFILVLWIVSSGIPWGLTQATGRYFVGSRFSTMVLPYFFILLSRALGKLSKPLGILLILILASANLGFWRLFLTGPGYQRQDWKDTASILSARARSGDAIIMVHLMSSFPLWYYFPNELHLEYFPQAARFAIGSSPAGGKMWIQEDPDTLLPLLGALRTHSKRQWVVLCESWVEDPENKILKWFLKEQHLILYRNFRSLEPNGNVRVFLFSRR